ncbi:MAG: hypothetical protein L3J02_08600, partial [Henriciella sp.]|nr:hypothetical protein [Henriciella sp.]
MKRWKAYFLAGLATSEMNPADDQVSLAVATFDLGVQRLELHAGWNSLGRLDGDYWGWHPWAGNWKLALLDFLAGRE